MLRRNKLTSQAGFTIIELSVVMVLALIVSLTAYTVFSTTLKQYFGLQQDGTEFTDLAAQSQRVATVLRGSTDIVSATSNDLVVYAYFYPNDQYVSQVHYYLNATSTRLYADVTPMTANPPIGVLIPANKKTYTVIEDFHQLAGVNLFVYLDDTGNTLAMPIADEHTIKGIQINLAVPADHPTPNGNQQISLQVSLRNRKTNL
ncbi:MAG TPA: prepilin-type N-terminal cleavage/methylation domain-containing protein [Candidatus Binatia bacterium]|nr:prepilin-type N-terminal cleavage/methylation domain-containing protein [Candidatus Binatia bacterium]